MDDDPQELHGNGNGTSDYGGFIRIADIQNIDAFIQPGKLIVRCPCSVLVRSRSIVSGHRQQGKLVAAGCLSSILRRFAVIDAASDPVQVDSDLAIAV